MGWGRRKKKEREGKRRKEKEREGKRRKGIWRYVGEGKYREVIRG